MTTHPDQAEVRRQKIADVTREVAPDLDRAIERLKAFCETQHDPNPPRSARNVPSDYPALYYADVRAVLAALDRQNPTDAEVREMVEAWDRLKNHLWQITKLSDDDAPYMRSIAEDTLQAISAINLPALLAAERDKAAREELNAATGTLAEAIKDLRRNNFQDAAELLERKTMPETVEIFEQAIRERKGS